MCCVIYNKGIQLQAASTQNVPCVNDLNITTLQQQIAILYTFFSITFLPDEEIFLNAFNNVTAQTLRKFFLYRLQTSPF